LSHIFDKFSQVEGVGRWEGTGLGLAIAQKLANIQGGVITVESEESKGSNFTLKLPARIAVGRIKPKPLPYNIDGARILVIDDNDINRRHLEEQISAWGFDCVSTGDGTTGLGILEVAIEQAIPVDALILDCQLAGVTGVDIATELRRDPRFAHLAIIFMTAQDVRADDERLSGLDLQAHLSKPVRTTVLRDTLVDAIRSIRIRRDAQAETSLPVRRQPKISLVSDRGRIPDPATRDSERPVAKANLRHAGDVLVAEDNEVNRIVFTQILEAGGIPYRIVNNGAEAITAWQECRPAMILMDLSMPVMDGFEAASSIRALELGGSERTPIVGVTSHLRDCDREICASKGMDDFITKPISPEMLERTIKRWTTLAELEQSII
jgi:CheY-like chemotaxis protein